MSAPIGSTKSFITTLRKSLIVFTPRAAKGFSILISILSAAEVPPEDEPPAEFVPPIEPCSGPIAKVIRGRTAKNVTIDKIPKFLKKDFIELLYHYELVPRSEYPLPTRTFKMVLITV